MPVIESYYEMPMIYIEDDDITWDWFDTRCRLNKEIRVDGGYLVPIKAMNEHYIPAFRSYIEFEYYDPDPYIYDILMDTLGSILSIVDLYIRDHYFVYISSSYS